MARRSFTPEEMEQLRENPYTAHVTEDRLKVTEEFRRAFREADEAGIKPTENVRKLGYDPRILGQDRISMLAYRIRHSADKKDDSGNGKEKCVAGEKAVAGERLRTLEATVDKLEEQINFMKGIIAIRSGRRPPEI